jgi:hypothetical protein
VHFRSERLRQHLGRHRVWREYPDREEAPVEPGPGEDIYRSIAIASAILASSAQPPSAPKTPLDGAARRHRAATYWPSFCSRAGRHCTNRSRESQIAGQLRPRTQRKDSGHRHNRRRAGDRLDVRDRADDERHERKGTAKGQSPAETAPSSRTSVRERCQGRKRERAQSR